MTYPLEIERVMAGDAAAGYPQAMTRTIGQAELQAAVLDALEAGEGFVVTRNGVSIGVLWPIPRSREFAAEQIVAMFTRLPGGSSAEEMRAEADAIFGEERIGDD